MFLANGLKATLRQYNRNENDEVFDDQNSSDITIKCCPYNLDGRIAFDEYTTREATGYYQLPRWVNVKVGDQILFNGKWNNDNNQFQTVLEVKEKWLFNHIENIVVAVK